MLKIDVHTHILPKEIPDWRKEFGYGGFITLDHCKPCCARMVRDDGKQFRDIGDNCWSPEKRLAECDRDDVDVQVLSTVPVMFSYWAKPDDTAKIAEFLNDHIAGIVRQMPKRFVGLGTLPMQDAGLAVAEVERCKQIGLAGVQIGTNVNQQNLGEPQFFEIFEACERLGMAVFVHPWDMMGEADMQKYWLPWLVGMPAEVSRAICSLIFSGTLEKLPDLRICFAHGGGAFPATLGRVQHGFEVRPDLYPDNELSPKDAVKKLYFDSLVHDQKVLEMLIDLIGTKRIMLGTDYPFPLGEIEPGSIVNSLKISDIDKERLFSGSALEWLRLKKGDFAEE